MKTGKVRGISDKDLAAILQEHQYRLGGLTGYALQQRRYNRRMLIAVVGLYAFTTAWLFLPYGWMIEVGNLFAGWW